MRKHVHNAVLATATGLTLAGGCSTALVSAVAGNGADPGGSPAGAVQNDDRRHSRDTSPQDPPAERNKAGDSRGELLEPEQAPDTDPRLPRGESTATSFWDAETASGRPMAFRTLASPYWPLGTKVKIIYNGRSEVGVVDDFGPAEWAVAQHDPPALVDLSEKMMDKLSGKRSNSVTVEFEVLEMGDGRTYRSSGTGYETAMRGR